MTRRGEPDELKAELAIYVLGRFEVTRHSVPIQRDAWGRRKTESLLKILLTAPGHIFSSDQLIEWLFGGEDPAASRRNLYGRVSELRHALEPQLTRGAESAYVRRMGHGYTFDPANVWVDTLAFRDLLLTAENLQAKSKDLDAIEIMERAIGICRGEFLEADRYEEWALEARHNWREDYMAALLRLAESYARSGDPHRAALACSRALSLEPWREAILQQLMRYHGDAGERSEAMRVYQRGEETLIRELNVDPSPETLAIRDEISQRESLGSVASRDKKRLAVLPMVNISQDPRDAYFADGITEELIYRLAKIPDIRVIAQTSILSYKGTKKTVSEIGRELNVGSVVEGSVRKADSSVRVTIQLIDTNNEEHLWAEVYDRPLRDVFAVQSDVAQRVADALQVTFHLPKTHDARSEPTASLETYDLYLKGRHVMKSYSIEDLERAVAYFKRALEIDPRYALASAGLADAACCLWFFGNPPEETLVEARQAADRAVRLAPALGDGYAAQARIRWAVEKDLKGADKLFRKAICLAPRNAELRRWHSQLLSQLGQEGEAFVEILRAHEIDPISVSTHLQLSEAYGGLGLDKDAAQQLEEVLELDPQHLGARMRRFYLRWARHDWLGAEVEIRRIITDLPKSPGPLLNYSEHLCAFARWGEAKSALDRALRIAPRPIPIWVTESEGVLRYMMGEYEKARMCLEESIAAQPQLRFSYWWLAVTQWMLEDYDAALRTLDGAEAKLEGFYRSRRTYMQLCIEFARGAVHARLGDPQRTQDKIDWIESLQEDLNDRALALAALCFLIGERDSGIAWLAKSVERRDTGLRRFHCFDLHAVFREEPRAAEVFVRTGLPLPVPPEERIAYPLDSRSLGS